ncbi:hypothetical protein [Paraliomyxa miuraensis]|uniref:hypothetical protein n=1 Tax=Paraliomyxa miuraensis TaxID=376150 RepID=UPI0022575DED|nr:hypothetical protein [Paraliomyxa miuraensis]MCX4239290.1 hypothetical protein [Paraliomyxa miuraensis]
MATDEPHEDQASDADPASSDGDAAARADEPEAPTGERDEDEPEDEPEVEPASESAAEPTSSDTADGERVPVVAKPAAAAGRASRLWWALPVLLVAELYVYGHAGRLQVCVGKEGETDFALVGQERTDANRWKFPRCETRDNLGLRSQRDAQLEDATKAACRGATVFRHQGEAKACMAQEQGWQHQVEDHFVPPWDPAYYRHLFWFFY